MLSGDSAMTPDTLWESHVETEGAKNAAEREHEESWDAFFFFDDCSALMMYGDGNMTLSDPMDKELLANLLLKNSYSDNKEKPHHRPKRQSLDNKLSFSFCRHETGSLRSLVIESAS